MGGTSEAHTLARTVAQAGIDAIYSYAGRVAALAEQPVEVRVGGFGGVDGLRAYLRDNAITHVVDATHPFAQQMSRNATEACAHSDVPLIAFSRAPWRAQTGDAWRAVPDIDTAVRALEGPALHVFLAIGRQNLSSFAQQPQHHYLLRLVDAPTTPLPLPDTSVVIARGPFSFESDRTLLADKRIDVVVSKNSGGTAAHAKLEAARALGIPVIMIARPKMPERRETHDVDEVMRWLHGETERGV
ncbi:MAG: cobalt-precorrin-6A reductase [Paracoccaceae bacterium]